MPLRERRIAWWRQFARRRDFFNNNQQIRNGRMSGATNTGVLEVKSIAASDDLTGAFEEFMTTFEAFKRENDQRLREIERRSADPLTQEKVERLSAALDEQKRLIRSEEHTSELQSREK